MAYDLEEQEQLASFKAWWSTYGNGVTWALTLVLGAYAAFNGWNYYQREQSAKAAVLYEEMQKTVEAKDTAKTLRLAGELEKDYARSSYAAMGALTAAKAAFDANDLKGARAQLEWAAANASDEHKSLAKVRLAGVLLDEKAYDEALKVLGGEFLPQFAASVADRKGDVLAAQNKLVEARAAYQAALAAMDKKTPGRELIVLKLEAIGGSAETPKAPA